MQYHFRWKRTGAAIRILVGSLGLCFLGQPFNGVRAASATAYQIDKTRSKFIVHVSKTGFLKTMGHNHTIEIRDFSGTAQVASGTAALGSLTMRVKAASLAVVDDVSASDKSKIEGTMRGHVLETSRYPEIIFKSVQIVLGKAAGDQYQVQIIGDLSLHGVTHRISIPTGVTLTRHTLKAHGEFPLKQTDYNIKPVSVMGGAVKVKNEVKLSFDIVAQS